MSTCRSCGAEIIWAKTVTGRKMPLDAEPVDPTKVDRTCIIDNGIALFGAIDCGPKEKHYVSHFASCKFADKHRRKS